jgi:tripartite-type tricarboxylate transporter receptor subunit TctC
MQISRRLLLPALALTTLAPWVAPALGQTFPQTRPISLIVPFAAGGGTDAIARNLAEMLREKLGQTVIVENVGGGGGLIAAQRVKSAAPDGHTLMLVTSTFVTTAAVKPSLPYDIVTDFTPIAMLGKGPMVIVVNNAVGVTSIPGMIQVLKDKPGEWNYVSSGIGSVTHLAGELFLQKTGTKMQHIPYRGSGPAVQDLLAGRGQAFFATIPTILGQIEGKTVTVLAVTSREPSPLFPGTPTVESLGIKDYNVGTWWGVVAPPKMPAAISNTLNTAINEATAGPAMKKRFEHEGASIVQSPPDALTRQFRDELAGWREVVLKGGIKVE